MKATEFLDLAINLTTAVTATEAHFRTAVSRAYYCAFHVARVFLAAIGYPAPQNAEGHAYVIRRLENCGDGDALRVASLLGDLRVERNKADYQLSVDKFKRRKVAMTAIERALRIQDAITRCRCEPIQSTIREGIAAHERRLGPS